MKHFTFALFISLIACERSTPSRAASPMNATETLVQLSTLDEHIVDSEMIPLALQAEDAVTEPQKEVVDGGEPERADRSETVVIRSGETLDAFARWTHTTVEEIASINHLDVREPLVPGRPLWLPITDPESFAATREGAFERRIDRFLSRRGGLAGIEGYTVVTGDTAWAIARDTAEVPTWILAAFNPDRALDELQVGDTLYLPVLTHVADAEEDLTVDYAMEEGCSH
jgi:LysM repeat protein